MGSNGVAGDEFGRSSAISGLTLATGAAQDDYGGQDGPGSFYIFQLLSADGNNNGILDECEILFARPTPVNEVGDPKNRFIAFEVPTGGGDARALRIGFASLHDPAPPNLPGHAAPNFWEASGQARWVGAVTTCDDEATGTTYKCAPLSCTPVYTDFDVALSGEPLYVYGQDIVPDSVYEVEVLGSDCQGNEGACAVVSRPVQIRTSRWGDVVAPFQDREAAYPTQPNVLDLSTAVDGLKSEPGALGEPHLMLQPNVLSPTTDAVRVLDVSRVVDAMLDSAYPLEGPMSCN